METEDEIDYTGVIDQAVLDLEESFVGQLGFLEKEGAAGGRVFLRSRPNLFINQGELYMQQTAYRPGPAGRMRAAIDKLMGNVELDEAKEAGP